MVENVADDGVEPKPARIEAFDDDKSIANVKLKVKSPFQTHIEEKPKLIPTCVAKLHGYKVDTTSCFNKGKMARAR